jgi:hypothetical protein
MESCVSQQVRRRFGDFAAPRDQVDPHRRLASRYTERLLGR